MKSNSIKVLITLLISFFSFQTSNAQTIKYNHRSPENPHYWSKNKPYEGYWQQDVHYKIDAILYDSLNLIDVPNYQLVYWNNSPDTLTEIYFHLYQNAFQPGSYMENLYLNNDQKVTFGKYEQEGLGTVYSNLTIDNQTVKTKLDNTILQVKLNKGLMPKDSIVINMSFKTYFDKGSLRRRMKYFEEFGSKHFDAVHWYPSICVYDNKFGWTTEQHTDKEFYANFGTFDVNISVPNHYIVEATGELTNESEVLPTELRQKIDLSNFTKASDTISTPIKADGTFKTWNYHAINVHNFAFTTDPKYRIREQYWNGVKVVTLAMEQNAHKWQGSGSFASDVTRIYSTDFGQYAWPKIVVADAKDGMEYPMLTLDNGTYPGHQGLLAHEMGHMWFYGMIGSNETYRALMDEGFTQFLTIWSLDKINGERLDYKNYIKPDTKKKWLYNHLNPSENRFDRLYYPYVKWVLEGYDHQLNTHSSDFNGSFRHGGGYGLVYYKTAVMLYNLRYVLGEEVFLEAMKHYFDTWKMKHPYPEDFRESIIHYTKTDLNWFFDEWLETTKYIDYSVDNVKAGTNKGEYEILFRRIGSMQMPIDFTVTTKSNKTYNYHIPNTWYEKKTSDSTLEKWYGWGNIQPTYTAKITIDEEIDNVTIDPSHYMADINLSNNQWKNRYHFQFDHRVKNNPNWYATENFWRPDLGYTAQDGLKVGLHVEGSYFKMLNRYSISGLYNTGLLKYDFDKEVNKTQLFTLEAKFDQKLRKIWRGLESSEKITLDAGVINTRLGFTKTFKERDLQASEHTKISIYHNTFTIKKDAFINYLLVEQAYKSNRRNNHLDLTVNRLYTYEFGTGNLDLNVRTPGFLSQYNYGFIELQSINQNRIWDIKLNTRVYGRFGYGKTPLESRLNINGANTESLFENRITRAQGLIPQDFTNNTGNLNFHSSGGLNLRGYSGILVSNKINQINYNNGKSGFAFNTELDFGRYTRIKGKLSNYLNFNPYLFADAGTLILEKKIAPKPFDQVLFDAGIGAEFQIKFYYLDIKPLIIRVDLPLFVQQKNLYNINKLVLGIGKSF